MKNLVIGLAIGLLLGSVVEAVAGGSGWSFGRFVTARVGISAGLKTQDGMFSAQSDGTRDMYSGRNDGATETFTVDADGDLTALTLTSSGALSAAGALTCSDAFFPESVTADPCAATAYGPGAIFYNGTSGFMCFCDASTDDLKMNDNSTACF